MKTVIDVSTWVKTPMQKVAIRWEVDGCSGTTICEAWRGQYEIEEFERAGYQVLSIESAEV